ncbi:hypothetical protein L596_019305 [Steinernema carpocapsae]|uniref:Uncharacterized protein n=1 Tax=Steinernema carpocapsae TaxID=34508 RepID=A0A4U5MQ26_STECR|nr:hypothetical protein L596_019305 [Steinernema carpocapsae]
MGFTLAGVLTALFFVAAAAHDDFLHGCSSHCQLNDADLTCWNRTNEFFERVTLSLMRQYVHVQVQRAQFMKKQKVKPDFKEMGDETIYRWSGEKPSNIEDEDGMTNKRLYTEIARSLLEAVKENVDKPDLKHNLMCPQGCEHSSRHWMWMFIGSAIVTCIITSLLVTVVCLLDRRDKRMSMLEEAKDMINK